MNHRSPAAAWLFGLLAVAFLVGRPGRLLAQEAAAATISGVAVDQSGGAMPGAFVSATDSQAGVTRTTVTEADGRFSITVPPGTYVVRGELSGFAPSLSDRTALAPGQIASLTLTFRIQPYGETVVVTGSRAPEELRTTPVAVTVIRGDTIDTSPAAHFGDLLRGVPGLNAIELSVRDVQLATRTATGRNARTTLALLDGRTVYQDYFGMVLWDLMPVNFNELKQVEVLRGPGSALWGANAMTGVINMITKSPREMLGTEAYIGVGERSTREAGILHAGARGALSYKASGSYYTQEAWARPATLPDGTPLPPYANQDTTQFKGNVRVDYDRSDRVRWRFDGGVATSGGVLLVSTGPFDVHPMHQAYGSVEYTNGSASLNVFVNDHQAHYSGLLGPNQVDVSSQSFHAEAKDSRAVGRHLLVYGGSVNHSRFDLTFAPDAHRREQAGAFLSDDIALTPRFKVSAGGRLDYFNTFGPSFSPRVGARYELAPGHTLRATFNRAYVAPSITENFADFPTSVEVPLPTGPYTLPIQILGDVNLARETIDAGEVGYTGVIGQRATVNLSVYKNRTQGLINLLVAELYTPADPPPGWPLPPETIAGIPLPKLFQFSSLGDLAEAGVEAGIDVPVGAGVSASANYSLQTTPELSGPDGAAVPFVVNTPPRHRANLGLALNRGRFMGSLQASFTDRAFWADVLSYTGWTDSFWLVNGTIGVTFGNRRFTWLLKGTNLADNAIQQHIFGDIIRRRVMTELRVKY